MEVETAGCLQIVLVDLAGSERLAKTGSRGTALREARHINRSLSFLEQVRYLLLIALHDRRSLHGHHCDLKQATSLIAALLICEELACHELRRLRQGSWQMRRWCLRWASQGGGMCRFGRRR